jgi:hypothetical protein
MKARDRNGAKRSVAVARAGDDVREARRRGVVLRLAGHSPAVLDVLALAWLTPDLEAAA